MSCLAREGLMRTHSIFSRRISGDTANDYPYYIISWRNKKKYLLEYLFNREQEFIRIHYTECETKPMNIFARSLYLTIRQKIMWRSPQKYFPIFTRQLRFHALSLEAYQRNEQISRKCTSYNTVFTRIYSDRQAWVNSVDPDEMQQNAVSHQGHALRIKS